MNILLMSSTCLLTYEVLMWFDGDRRVKGRLKETGTGV